MLNCFFFKLPQKWQRAAHAMLGHTWPYHFFQCWAWVSFNFHRNEKCDQPTLPPLSFLSAVPVSGWHTSSYRKSPPHAFNWVSLRICQDSERRKLQWWGLENRVGWKKFASSRLCNLWIKTIGSPQSSFQSDPWVRLLSSYIYISYVCTHNTYMIIYICDHIHMAPIFKNVLCWVLSLDFS